MPTIRKNLPVGFRHLFSPKEIKQLECQTGLHFGRIHFSHTFNTTRYQPEQLIQSAFHPVTVSGFQKEGIWRFSISQIGFRRELLTNEQEAIIKYQIVDTLSSYLLKIATSIETDFLRRPQLMIDVTISNNEAKIYTRESR